MRMTNHSFAIFEALPSSLKFTVVGALGTILNLAIMTVLIEKAAAPTAAASCIATEVSILHNFFLNNFWTFGSRKQHNTLFDRFIRFHLLALFSLAANVGAALLLVRIGIWYLPAQGLGILSAWFINYLTSNHLVFPDAA